MADIHITDTREFERFEAEIRTAVQNLDQSIRNFRAHVARVQKVWLDRDGKQFVGDMQGTITRLEREKASLERDLQRRLQAKIRAVRNFKR